VAIGRTFAILKEYQLDGNKEMVALGTMNVVGSMTSCYITTGSYMATLLYIAVINHLIIHPNVTACCCINFFQALSLVQQSISWLAAKHQFLTW
jgi:hypothetical protein